MSSTYVAIRDDSGQRSLSVNERDFLRSCALSGSLDEDSQNGNNDSKKIFRSDGRRGNDVRKVRLQLDRWDNGAEATVQWGVGTRVTSLCTAELVPPSADRPNEGIVNFTVDLSPMAAPSFRLAPAVSTGYTSSGVTTSRGSNFSDQDQRLLSNRILRCIERIILVGGALDAEALVLEGGKWVWRFTVALTVLDAGGNLLDACVLAAVAVLRHYRKPQVDLSSERRDTVDSSSASAEIMDTKPIVLLPTMIPSTIKEANPLPLHHSPLSISFGLIPADDAVNSTSSTSIVAALIDPTDREELVQSGSLTIAMNIHSEVCLLDYGGGCELTPNKLKECWKVAEGAIKELCQLLEEALSKADEQAQAERLRLLQLQRYSSNMTGKSPLLFPPADSKQNIPFLQQIDDNMDVDFNVDETKVQQVETEAEEAYRKHALDYATGHVATAVREENDKDRSSYRNQAGSLLAAMLKSVEQPTTFLDETVENPTSDSCGDAMIVDHARQLSDERKVENKDENINRNTDATETRATTKNPVAMDTDDDDEEPMVLQSEFESIKKEVEVSTDILEPKPPEEDPDIEDLSMAIKPKKSKRKKLK